MSQSAPEAAREGRLVLLLGSASGLAGALHLWLAMSVSDAVPAVIGSRFIVVSMTGLLGANYIGPPIAGLLLGLTSEAVCFAINGFSFLALITAILVVRSTPPTRATGSVGQVFKEGVRYAWHTWVVRMLIITLIALNLTASAYAVLLPVFAGDATTLGWLWGGRLAAGLLPRQSFSPPAKPSPA